jgi:hypothetical protein
MPGIFELTNTLQGVGNPPVDGQDLQNTPWVSFIDKAAVVVHDNQLEMFLAYHVGHFFVFLAGVYGI